MRIAFSNKHVLGRNQTLFLAGVARMALSEQDFCRWFWGNAVQDFFNPTVRISLQLWVLHVGVLGSWKMLWPGALGIKSCFHKVKGMVAQLVWVEFQDLLGYSSAGFLPKASCGVCIPSAPWWGCSALGEIASSWVDPTPILSLVCGGWCIWNTQWLPENWDFCHRNLRELIGNKCRSYD